MVFDDPATLDKAELEQGETFAPRFDDKGLILAVTTEAGSGDVLMVAYMNAEALTRTLETGDVHYFSRSRNSLWRKGESSGEVQRLVEMRTDCDQDALLLRVEQTGRGAACHTGRKSCFYRRVKQTGGAIALVQDSGEPLFDPSDVYTRD